MNTVSYTSVENLLCVNFIPPDDGIYIVSGSVMPDVEPLDCTTIDFIHTFLALVLTSKNPRLTLASYGIMAGIDLSYIFGTNCESDIAKQLGVSRQALNKTILKLCQQHHVRAKPYATNR